MSWIHLQAIVLEAARAATGLAVNWLIQSALLIIAGLALAYWLRGRGSAVQSAVYRTTLVAVLACPLATWGLSLLGVSGWSLEMPTAYTVDKVAAEKPLAAEFATGAMPLHSPTSGAVDLETPNEVASLAAAPAAESALRRLEATPEAYIAEQLPTEPIRDVAAPAAIDTIAPASVSIFNVQRFGIFAAIAGVLWVAVSGWLLARLALAWRQLHRLRRSAWSAEPATMDTCHEIAAMLQVVPPEVLHSPYLPSPCLAGVRRPAVLLPEAEMSLPVRDVLVHELAHLRRHDCFWNALRRVATALLSFQPLLWKLSSRLEATAEEVCDDYVVQLGGDRRQYAHRLVDIAELSVAPLAAAGVGIVSFRSMLAARVTRIMDTSRSLSTRVGSVLLALVLIAGLAATVLVGLVGLESDTAMAEPTASGTTDTQAAKAGGADSPNKDALTSTESDEHHIKGRVVAPDGKPVVGATVFADWVYVGGDWPRPKREPSQQFEHTIVDQTKSDANGNFELKISKNGPHESRLSHGWNIAAFARGFGPAWKRDVHVLKDSSPTLQLTHNQPIRGRIVDLLRLALILNDVCCDA